MISCVDGRTSAVTRVTLALSALCLCAVAELLYAPAIASAHEIGTTRVTVQFDSARFYQADVVCDPESLLAKLEKLARRDRSALLTAAEYKTKIEALQAYVLAETRVAFDGTPVVPRFEYLPPASAAPTENAGVPAPATIRLTGKVPDGASAFSWSFGLTFSSYALSVTQQGRTSTEWLDGNHTSRSFALGETAAPLSRLRVAGRYFLLGLTHIIPKGTDHVLFVLGIFLLSQRLRDVLWQVSAFTLAHSLTLGLTIYGLVSIRPSVVEPLIALSIAYVAIENLVTRELKPWRIALVFAFGLLHGMGFAGVLRELGLPRSEFLTALLTFNAGVEAGQLAVVAVASLAVARWYHDRDLYRLRIVLPASALIAATGIYWTVERLLAAHLLASG